MSRTFSVVIPVLDGARYLPELLAAVRAQGRDVELLVVDSGSTDGSAELAHAGGADVLEIPQSEFGHGRTRNLAAERTTGELICFLTQDATPVPGWLDAYEQAFALANDVGAAFGPHLPRPDTSPMIARELTDFFAGFSPDGAPALLGAGDPMFLSNVNACYRRDCWEQIRFDDVRYSEDQAFARAMGKHGWRRAYQPSAGVLHAHDYSPVDFMRRYFDEYRGLRETSGHVERIGVRSTLRDVRGLVSADQSWMRDQGWTPQQRATAGGRSLFHHTSRKFAAALGSQAHKLPPAVQRTISLEGAVSAGPPRPLEGPKPTVRQPARSHGFYQAVVELSRDGAVPVLDPVPGMADAERLHIAVVIPPFRRGSGGHSTIYNLLSRLEERGHTVTTWIHDPAGRHNDEWPAVIRANLREYFRPISGPVYKGFEHWHGADIALATGWDTVYAVQRLPDCRARAYLVQDHEPEFFPTSAESVFAERTYTEGLYCIAASPWLSELVQRRYGAESTSFQLGVDHGVYQPRAIERRRDTVIFYAREVTARRAVPLGVLALQELQRRRPDLRFVLFGNEKPIDTPFAYEDLGVASPDELAWAYSEATVGLSLSLTNYSLIPQEMLACGLPCVELAGRAIEGVFGPDGPIELAGADPVQLADALERLLGDAGLWERRAHEGLAFAAERTWDRAADEVEAGLRQALRARELGADHPFDAPAPPITGPVPQNWAESARMVPVRHPVSHEVTNRLFERLAPEDVAAVQSRIDEPEMLAHWNLVDEQHQRTLALILGAWYEVPAVLEKTGLRPDQPPEDVHAMARGPLSGGGSLYYADMLAELMRGVGSNLDEVRRGLDFGSSSGRTVRALHAAYPQAEWHGVDPNEPAIAWAQAHLPGIDFRVSPQDPPLPYEDGFFDFVVAISIWSHYGEQAAIRWLEEMHRVIAPGGHLIFSTHGLQSISYYAEVGERSPAQLTQIRRTLYQRDYWFFPEFGEAGDWGVKHQEWGTAFFTPEWLARVATPAWSIEDFAVGQNASNQDMYVLRRR
jgi:glycosyltransferase involved in cell wall biosynthesis/SAM-dependent methyltransferase/GT2 family glycosyltransferase